MKFSEVSASHDDFPSPLISLFHGLNSTITQEYELKPFLSISACHNQELTLSKAYTEYCIRWVQHTLCTTSFQDRLSPASSQFLISQQIMFNWILYIPTITSSQISTVSAPVLPLFITTTSKYSSYLARLRPPCASPNLVAHCLQLYLQTCSIAASKFAQS